MIRISTEQEFIEAFRPIDKDYVELPNGLKFPFIMKDSISWVEPSGHRAYLFFEERETKQPVGIVFRRAAASPDNPAFMCDWCHTIRSGDGVGLMTVNVSKDRRIGLTLCRDLGCHENVRTTPNIHDMRESLSSEQKVENILKRMSRFARTELF